MNVTENFKVEFTHPIFGPIVCDATFNESTNVFEIMQYDSFAQVKTINVDLSALIDFDVEGFKELNKRNDEKHQVHIDTLKIHKIKLSATHIRVYYVFDQYLDNKCWRICAGKLTDYAHAKFANGSFKLWPECYSPDNTVYW